MNELPHSVNETLREDGEFAVARAQWRNGLPSRLIVAPVLEQPMPASRDELHNTRRLGNDKGSP
jgi:hypothetical protein